MKQITMAFFFFFMFFHCAVLLAVGEQTLDINRIMEKENISGKVPAIPNNVCTFALRVKLLGPGGDVPKANPNAGMLFSVASGYYEGIRAWYSWDTSTVAFEIGRVAEKSSVSVRSKLIVMPNVLHDFVFTYDGKIMRIYIDGLLAGEREYVGKIETKNQPIKVGFVHYGIGYNRMFVEKLEYYPKVLTQSEVTDRFLQHPENERKKIELAKTFELIRGTVDLTDNGKSRSEYMTLVGNELDKNDPTRIEYYQALILSGEIAKAVSWVTSEAEVFMALPKPDEKDTTKLANWTSRLYSLVTGLDSVIQHGIDVQTCRALREQLAKKYPEELHIWDKIQTLEVSMVKRAGELEKESLRQFALTDRQSSEYGITLHLSPRGNDAHDGSAKRPFASLTKALSTANTLAARGTNVGVLVEDGVYYCDQTEHIQNTSLENRGTIRVQASAGATPVFSGKVALKGFKPIDQNAMRMRLQEAVRDKIVVCDLKACGITDFGAIMKRGYPTSNTKNPWVDLYIDDQVQTLARWPNQGDELLPFGAVIPGPNAETQGRNKRSDSGTFHYDFDRIERWKLSDDPDKNDIWAFGLFQWEWAGCLRKVLKIDQSKKLITVDYPNVSGRFHYYFLNVFEELDTPGEFYIDRTSGMLYLYPPRNCDLNRAKVELSVFNGPFVKLDNVAKCVFNGLIFSGCRQTAFECHDCKNCYLDRCKIEQAGLHALVMNRSSFSGIFNSKLEQLGGSGVRFQGGDRKTLRPSGLTIHNCLVRSFCQVDRAYEPAVHSSGCGMVATNNLIYDSPHHAFRMDGNDQYVARNEVHSVVYEYSDQSGIDIYCDPMYRGIVIEKNFWHHIGSNLALCGQAGIRLDDSISGVVMKDNIFYRSSGGHFGGIQIHGGKDNLAVGNLFVNCTKAFSFSPWSSNRYLDSFIRSPAFKALIPVYSQMGVYPFVDDDLEKHINRNYIIRNEMINCDTFQSNGHSSLFVFNKWKKIDSAPVLGDSIPTPGQLRIWIEQVSGRSLADIGLIGQDKTLQHFVSPNYSGK